MRKEFWYMVHLEISTRNLRYPLWPLWHLARLCHHLKGLIHGFFLWRYFKSRFCIMYTLVFLFSIRLIGIIISGQVILCLYPTKKCAYCTLLRQFHDVCSQIVRVAPQEFCFAMNYQSPFSCFVTFPRRCVKVSYCIFFVQGNIRSNVDNNHVNFIVITD